MRHCLEMPEILVIAQMMIFETDALAAGLDPSELEFMDSDES